MTLTLYYNWPVTSQKPETKNVMENSNQRHEKSTENITVH